MSEVYNEFIWEYNGHISKDRVKPTWNGTVIKGDTVPSILPKFRYRQTNGTNGYIFYTDPDNDPYIESCYLQGGQPEDVEDLFLVGYFRTASAYSKYLRICLVAVNENDQLVSYGDMIMSGSGSFDHAFPIYKDDHGTVTYDMKGKANGVYYPGISNIDINFFWSDDSQYYPNTNTSDGVNDIETEFIRYIETDIPLFEKWDDIEGYVKNGDTSKIINATAEYEPDLSKPYFISNQYASYDQFNGEITPSDGATYTWASERMLCNTQPVLYYTGNGYELRLKAKDVVCSKYMAAPGYIIENIPESSWTEQALEYSGPFYGTMQSYYEAKHTTLPNGTYLYGGTLSTNIPIFKDQTTAQTALDTGDYSAAENYGAISTGNYYNPPTTGTTEGDTSFGSGYPTSPFCTAYVCSRNDVLNVANAFYTSDTSLLDNIKKGLELFGANPYEAICGLSWFPFDINTVATALAQSWVYFGSYKYEPGSLSIDKIVNMNASGYVDAGTVNLSAQFNSYRDLEPYTNLSVYLPYHGWEQLDIAKYYKKTVNIRYYVDIFTNTYACALVANGQIVDVFPGNIGVTLPICGSNLSEYANSMLRAVLGTVGGTAGGAMTGAMLGGGVPGAVIGATLGGFAGLAKGTFEMAQKGSPKDHLMVKGNFSGASASYMPNYVIFRYDIHNLIVPDNLTQLYGRPSSASGKIKQFSGFLKCDTIKLNTGRMTDAEISETLTLLREGIFL